MLCRTVKQCEWHMGSAVVGGWCCCRWAVLFSHPRDYTPVCTTELGRVLLLGDEFKKRDVKLIALSCDSVEDHKGWSKVLARLTIVGITHDSCMGFCISRVLFIEQDRRLSKLFFAVLGISYCAQP